MVCACMLSHFSPVLHCAILWTAAQKDPLSMGFSRQENWNGLLCPSPGDLPDPGIEPTCLMFPAFVGGFFTRASWQVQWYRLTDFQGRNREEDVKKRLVDMGGWRRGRSGWDELREQHWHMYSAMWISLEDIRLSESRFHLCEMSRIGKTTRTEKLVVA